MPIVENLSVYFADFGVPCAANGQAFTGLLDQPDDTLSAAGLNVLSTSYLLQATTADVVRAGIATGTVVTVSGQPYVVRDVIKVDDGQISHLTLSK